MIQKKMTQYREYVYDFAVDGGATGVKELRAADKLGALEEGVIVKDVIVVTEAAIVGGTSLTFGTVTDDDGFLVDSLAALASLNSVVRAGEKDGALIWDSTADAKKAYRVPSTSNSQKVCMNIGSTAITAGKLRVILECYKPGTEAGAV